MGGARALALAAALAQVACPNEQVCEEDIRAQALGEVAEIAVDGAALTVEIARAEVERERGWKHRRCDLEGLLLVADAGDELAIWGCGLTLAVDLLWIREGVVVAAEGPVAPCPEPCGGCPILGAGIVADAVLEVPAGALSAAVGDPVEGIAAILAGG